MIPLPTLVAYRKYFYGKDKILKKPVKLIYVGYKWYEDSSKLVVSESVYVGDVKPIAKVKVLPVYETLNTSNIDFNLPKIWEIELIDTMLVEKETNKKILLNLKSTIIKKAVFLVYMGNDHFVFSHAYSPKQDKFTNLIAVPKQNIISYKVWNI